MTSILNIIEDLKTFNNKNFQTVEPAKGPYPSLPQAHVSYPVQAPAHSSIMGPRVGIYGTYYDWHKPPVFRLQH